MNVVRRWDSIFQGNLPDRGAPHRAVKHTSFWKCKNF